MRLISCSTCSVLLLLLSLQWLEAKNENSNEQDVDVVLPKAEPPASTTPKATTPEPTGPIVRCVDYAAKAANCRSSCFSSENELPNGKTFGSRAECQDYFASVAMFNETGNPQFTCVPDFASNDSSIWFTPTFEQASEGAANSACESYLADPGSAASVCFDVDSGITGCSTSSCPAVTLDTFGSEAQVSALHVCMLFILHNVTCQNVDLSSVNNSARVPGMIKTTIDTRITVTVSEANVTTYILPYTSTLTTGAVPSSFILDFWVTKGRYAASVVYGGSSTVSPQVCEMIRQVGSFPLCTDHQSIFHPSYPNLTLASTCKIEVDTLDATVSFGYSISGTTAHSSYARNFLPLYSIPAYVSELDPYSLAEISGLQPGEEVFVLFGDTMAQDYTFVVNE